MDKALRDRMYNDLIELGIIDEKEDMEEHTPETLWQLMVNFQNSKEVF